jgi:hypothetical protein
MSQRAAVTTMRPAKPLAPRAEFLARLGRGATIAGAIIGIGLALGAAGFHFSEDLPWLDATLNASMLLAGEGPIAPFHTVSGKLFATVYALFSGIFFITATSLILAPVVHRFLHRFHLELSSTGEGDEA